MPYNIALSLIKLTITIHVCMMYINIVFMHYILCMIKVRLGVLVVCGECYNLGKLIGLLFLFCLPLSIMFLKTLKIRGMTSLAL